MQVRADDVRTERFESDPHDLLGQGGRPGRLVARLRVRHGLVGHRARVAPRLAGSGSCSPARHGRFRARRAGTAATG